MSVSINGSFRFEPEAKSDLLCHQGASMHVHDEQFLTWWERFGSDLQRFGPPTGYQWRAEDPTTVPYWTKETIAANKRRVAKALKEQERIALEIAGCPYVSCTCGYHE